MISSAKHCTVNQFIEAKYENNLSVLGEGAEMELEAALQNIYIEYCDLLGPEAVPDLPLLTSIHNTKIRIEAMKWWIFIQRDCLQNFGIPYESRIPDINKYNHSLTWNDDKEDFLLQLTRIESKEAKYKLRLAEDEKSLENTRIANGNASPLETGRIAFIEKVMTLGDIRKRDIDMDKMTMEQLGILEARHNKAAREAKQN